MTFNTVFLLLVLSSCLQVFAYDLDIKPAHVRVSEESSLVTITCLSSVPLTACQFRWWDVYSEEGPLLDLSLGALSRADSAHLTNTLTNYSYAGRSLEAGDCAVTLQVEGWRAWMVACRVQTGGGGAWSYRWADLYAQGWSALPSFVAPREAVALPGGLARFLFLSPEPLTSCTFFLPEVGRLVLDAGAASANSTGRHLYHGGGLEVGECGLSVYNVTEELNGLVRVWAASPEEKGADTRLMALVVARPPSHPVMHVTHDALNTTATCRAAGGRPDPSVTWTLGDKVLRQDDVNELPGGAQDRWRWPWMEGAMEQRVELRLGPQDLGKDIKCSFSHVALRRPLEQTHTIINVTRHH